MIDKIKMEFINSNGLQLLQHMQEFNQLLGILNKYDLKNILEIGSYTGASMYLFSGFCKPKANIISIDPDPKEKINLVINELNKEYCVHQIKIESQNEDALNKTKEITDTIDFLYIDDCHAY